ncbi:exonuclease domain-containing protein [Bradyrhizobium cenepequi]
MTARIARVLDYETTGTPEDQDAEIIEFGRIDVDLFSRQVFNPWTSLACPRGPIPAVTKAVHHITEADVADAPPARDLWDEFYSGCGPLDILVAHNAKFEMHFHAGDGRPWIDTYKVARVVWPDAPTHSNQGLRYWLDLPVDRERASPPHRALPDAYVTAHLFVRLLDHKTVDEMVHISKYPALLKIMNFGKHKGTTFEAAPLDYLEWIRDKSDMDEDTKFTARYWVAKRLRGEA